MENLLSLFVKYGWQICVLGVLGSILIGIIKTPIRARVFRGVKDAPVDDIKLKHMENVFDSCVFIGTYVIAVLLAVGYLLYIQQLAWLTVVSASFQVWMVQSVCYGIWKKMSIKRLLETIIKSIKASLIKRVDKNKDGRISFEEATEAIQSLIKNGTIDINKVLEIAEESVPGIVADIVEQVSTEAQVEISPVKETVKLVQAVSAVKEEIKEVAAVKEEMKEAAEAKPGVIKAPVDTQIKTIKF